MKAEEERLKEAQERTAHWRRWGPFLSERQWGTVREDYSPYGTAWEFFSHDHARSRAYRWGEDGLAGFSDNHQRLCFALALWNEHDPCLKEAQERTAHWRRWGPFLSERQWGTVREDYSPYGTAWEFFSHDHARSRAYRWGEDGLAGFSDNHQRLCFALALWNEHDPILK